MEMGRIGWLERIDYVRRGCVEEKQKCRLLEMLERDSAERIGIHYVGFSLINLRTKSAPFYIPNERGGKKKRKKQ